jgi:hypothetical protein
VDVIESPATQTLSNPTGDSLKARIADACFTSPFAGRKRIVVRFRVSAFVPEKHALRRWVESVVAGWGELQLILIDSIPK